MIIYILIIISFVCACILIRRKLSTPVESISLKDEHCLVTGGSSGIGLELSKLAAGRGASVTMIARSKERLEMAREKVLAARVYSSQQIQIFCADVAKDKDLSGVVLKAEANAGPVSFLINCAGTSISSCFEDTSLSTFQAMMDANLIGSVNMTQAVLPLMKERKKGHIVFVSSLAGLLGLYGYTAYAASKFAVRGFAESLSMEVKPYNVSITVSYPPDTDTPGFAEENKHKPRETALISESGGLYTAEKVAYQTLQDTLDKKFTSSVGFEGNVLCTLCSGMSPIHSFMDLVLQVFTMGVLRIVALVYHKQCDHIVRKCAEEKRVEQEKNRLTNYYTKWDRPKQM